MMEKMLNIIGNIPKDKLLHSYIVLIISLICYDVLDLVLPKLWNIIVTIIISTMIMLWKEWYDSKRNCTHSVEFKDIVAGYGGLILGLLLKLL